MALELAMVDAEKLAALLNEAAECIFSYARNNYDERLSKELLKAAWELKKKDLDK